MTSPIPLPVTVAVEGPSDVPVVRRILATAGLALGPVYGQSGKATINASIRAYNNAARHSPWFVLRDLDSDAPCAPELAKRLLPEPAAWMRFRIAVREVEAWLLAETVGIAAYLGVPRGLVPVAPETLDDAKLALVNLARRSKKSAIRKDMVPYPGLSSVVGPGYVSRLGDFATGHWNIDAAADRCDSLRRCISAVAKLADHF